MVVHVHHVPGSLIAGLLLFAVVHCTKNCRAFGSF
jgi:hypothetical protein